MKRLHEATCIECGATYSSASSNRRGYCCDAHRRANMQRILNREREQEMTGAQVERALARAVQMELAMPWERQGAKR